MRGGQVRIALYALLVLVFLLLPPSDPAVASPDDPPTIDWDHLDQHRPEFPRQLNAPPEVRIESPAHGQEYLQGNGILLIFIVDDPDDSEWQLKWEVYGLTNGYFEQIDYTRIVDDYSHTIRGLPLGGYHLTVYLRDLEYQATASLEFMVVSEYTDPVSAGASPWWYWACCITTFIVIVPISFYLVKRRQASVERTRAARVQPPAGGPLTTSPPPSTSYPQVYQRPPLPPPLPKQVPPMTPAPYPMGSGKAETPPAYAPRGIEHPPPPPPPPPQPPPPPPPPPRAPTQAVVEDWRVGSVEEFVELIEDLPEGFPEPLWGIDWWTLGKVAVSTSQLRGDGTPVCTVNGKQYHADKRDMDTFMQEV